MTDQLTHRPVSMSLTAAAEAALEGQIGGWVREYASKDRFSAKLLHILEKVAQAAGWRFQLPYHEAQRAFPHLVQPGRTVPITVAYQAVNLALVGETPHAHALAWLGIRHIVDEALAAALPQMRTELYKLYAQYMAQGEPRHLVTPLQRAIEAVADVQAARDFTPHSPFLWVRTRYKTPGAVIKAMTGGQVSRLPETLGWYDPFSPEKPKARRLQPEMAEKLALREEPDQTPTHAPHARVFFFNPKDAARIKYLRHKRRKRADG